MKRNLLFIFLTLIFVQLSCGFLSYSNNSEIIVTIEAMQATQDELFEQQKFLAQPSKTPKNLSPSLNAPNPSNTPEFFIIFNKNNFTPCRYGPGNNYGIKTEFGIMHLITVGRDRLNEWFFIGNLEDIDMGCWISVENASLIQSDISFLPAVSRITTQDPENQSQNPTSIPPTNTSDPAPTSPASTSPPPEPDDSGPPTATPPP